MTPHIVAFNGSPRKGGNTETLLAGALEGAAQAGATTEFHRLQDFSFSPCRNCGGCERTGVCRFASDDMGKIYEALDRASLFIMATPIYFATVSAQTKAMVDRCQAVWSRKYLLKKPHADRGRKGILLSVGGFEHRNFWPCARKVVRTWYTVLDIQYLGGLFYHGVDERGAVRKHPCALAEAFDAGQRLARGQGPDPEAEGAK